MNFVDDDHAKRRFAQQSYGRILALGDAVREDLRIRQHSAEESRFMREWPFGLQRSNRRSKLIARRLAAVTPGHNLSAWLDT